MYDTVMPTHTKMIQAVKQSVELRQVKKKETKTYTHSEYKDIRLHTHTHSVVPP